MTVESAKEAARRLSAQKLQEGFEPQALHEYTDAQGNPLFYRIRLKHPDGRKWMRPMRLDGNRYVPGEPSFSHGKPLYRLQALQEAPDDATVWVVEGESCADALTTAGVLATTSGGASSADSADWTPLQCRTVRIWPDHDEPGFKYAKAVADRLRVLGCEVGIIATDGWGMAQGDDCVDFFAKFPSAADPVYLETMPLVEREPEPPLIRITSADTIVARPIRWLWPGWLARGKLHILAGAPGSGKTTLALSLAASLSRAGRWPDGLHAPVGNILVWSGEDDPADTLVPRLRAAGADLSRVFFVGDALTDGEPRPFDPAIDLAALEWEAGKIGDVGLMICDPVVSAVAGDSHKNTEVRRALQPIVNLAAKLDVAVLGISHFSKGTAGRDPLERVTGSIAFGALARLVLVTAKSEDGGRLLARAKSNIGPDGGGFGYSLEQVHADGLEASRVVWGEPLEGSAKQLLGDAEMVGDSPRDDAAEWLTDMLSGAEVAVPELRKQATAAGFSWRTIERAKSDLGVVSERISQGSAGSGRWYWRLPSKTATGKTANPTTNFGGLAESVAPQGFPEDWSRKTANPECGGLAGGLADPWEDA